MQTRNNNNNLKTYYVMLGIIQFVLSGIALGLFVWFAGYTVKSFLIDPKHYDLYRWTDAYFHPMDSNQLNYLLLCWVFGFLGFVLYFANNSKNRKRVNIQLSGVPYILFIATIILSCIVILEILFGNASYKLRSLGALFVVALPLLWFQNKIAASLLKRKKLLRIFATMFVALFSLIMISEHFQLIKGPIYLMNDYAQIYEETKVNDTFVNNREFLENLKIAGITGTESFSTFRREPQNALGNKGKAIAEELRTINVETLKQFWLANAIEFTHQDMARGQINHIVHILNPINAYKLGKPLQYTYIQYGLGNTFLMKWVMELFGGVSLHAYYKTYLLYIVYLFLFLILLFSLFRESIYIAGAFTGLTLCFLLMGYIAYVIAPGIIPSIHLMDAPAIIFLIAFFRRKNPLYFVLASLSGILGIIINGQFGISLFAALFVATSLFIFENKSGLPRLFWFISLILAACAGLAAWKYSQVGMISNTFPYFLAGLFSWPAPNYIIGLTILYLVISYAFTFLLRESRSDLKYIFVCLFCYCQAILLYFYWSGIINHLFPILPFFSLQLFLMLRIARETFSRTPSVWEGRIQRIVVTVTMIFMIMIPLAAYPFYKQKNAFYNSFAEHKCYTWTFDRASLITTIPTEIIQESVFLIRKYSNAEKPEVFILSKYDNLIPFLAHRYSAAPFFDVSSYLFSKKEFNLTVETIRNGKPKYLFVDTNIDQSQDLLSVLHKYKSLLPKYSLSNGQESTARMGRYEALRAIFDEFRLNYEKIEHGRLISVYKRKGM